MKIIVIEADGLRAEFLGPYGNDWVETPSLNRIAASGFVFDHCLIGSPHRGAQTAALWTGLHPAQMAFTQWRIRDSLSSRIEEIARTGIFQEGATERCVVSSLRERGWKTVLISPERSVLTHPLAQSFEEHRLIGGTSDEAGDPERISLRVVRGEPEVIPLGRPAEDWAETRTALVFSELCETLSQMEGAALVWCHLSDLRNRWDAPLAMRMRHHEEGDPEPWPGTNVPRLRFRGEADPDWLLPFVSAYAAQVEVLDLCLAGLWSTLEDIASREPWMLVITSARGMPLGEHGWLGTWHAPLHAELLHIPLIIAFSDGAGQSERSQALVYLHDLAASILSFSGGDTSIGQSDLAIPPNKTWVAIGGEDLLPVIRGELDQVRDRLFVWDGHRTLAVRTRGWFAQVRLVGQEDAEEIAESCNGTEDGEEAVSEHWTAQDLTVVSARADLANLVKMRTQEGEDSLSDWEIEELRRRVRLFVKPDDRWEVNEVADRCPQIAGEFLKITAEFLYSFQSLADVSEQNARLAMSVLPNELVRGPEA
ncbi:sulfatase-like hydrolase/transferase [Thermogutta sp.]|jgi:arylsulfatase A-like enzyme|uniref:sulfatase-like hydrolase/transferase n=1 Tax=Thermogutta sp. TaxID=1962930 RepID=UPI0032207FAD